MDCRAAACFPEQVEDREDKGHDSPPPGSAASFNRWFTFIHSSTHFLDLDATINTVSRRKKPEWAPEPAAKQRFSILHCTRAQQEVVVQPKDYSSSASLGSDCDLAAVCLLLRAAASSSEA